MSKQGRVSRAFAWIVAGFLAAAGASAEGWYAGAFYKAADSDDVQFATSLGTVTSTLDDGSGMGVAVGREMGAFRAELEWTTFDLDVRDHLLGGAALPGPTGVVDVSSYLVNIFYHFNANGTFSPYLGAGLGFAEVDFDGFGVTPIPEVLQDSDSVFTYQVVAGVEARIGDGWRLFADYRMQTADSLEVTVSPAAGAVGSKIDLETQGFNIGARYRF